MWILGLARDRGMNVFQEWMVQDLCNRKVSANQTPRRESSHPRKLLVVIQTIIIKTAKDQWKGFNKRTTGPNHRQVF